MNQATRAKLLVALAAMLDELIDDKMDPSWGMVHVPQDLGFLMAQAALQVVDIVIATEVSLDGEGLLAVDENGVAR